MNLPHGIITTVPSETYIYMPVILRVVKELLKLGLVVCYNDPNRSNIEYQMIDTVKESLRKTSAIMTQEVLQRAEQSERFLGEHHI